MAAHLDVLDLDRIDSHLRTQFVARAGQPNELWQTLDSTNTRATQLSSEGAKHGLLVLALQQTAGRGRLGRQWISPTDSGIYASFLLRPEARMLPNLATITLAIGVAVSRAILQVVGVEIGLKWVNDLVFEKKKLGGILCEMSARPTGNALIVGIGINVRFEEKELPNELKNKIIWLEQIAKRSIDPNLVIAEIANQMEDVYETLLQGKSDLILDEWRKRSITLGRQIVATSGERTIEGVAVDVAASGALIVDVGGETIELHAGEISIRTADGEYC